MLLDDDPPEHAPVLVAAVAGLNLFMLSEHAQIVTAGKAVNSSLVDGGSFLLSAASLTVCHNSIK